MKEISEDSKKSMVSEDVIDKVIDEELAGASSSSISGGRDDKKSSERENEEEAESENSPAYESPRIKEELDQFFSQVEKRQKEEQERKRQLALKDP